MNFDLSEEEAAVQQLAAQILGEATSFDRTRKVESDEAGPGFDVALWAQLAESNLIGLASPESLGGQGFGFLALCLLLEEAGRNLAPVPLLESVVYSLLPIQQFGNERLQRDLLPKVISGETWLTAALSEIGVPTSARVVNTVLTKTKDGRYRLRGEKICVPFAAGAHRILVSASGPDGLGLFLISPTAPGVSLEEQQTMAHERQFVVKLDGVEVCDDDILAAPGRGESVLDWLEPRAKTALAAIAVGAAAEGLRQTAEYTSTRKQFGREIGSFQGVSLRAADAYIDVEAMRATMWQAAWQIDSGRDAQKSAAVAKWWACMGGHRVSHTCQHLHGGIGSDIDYPIHRFFLRLKHVAMTLGGGSEQLSILGRLIADEARDGRTAEDILS